MLKSSAKMSAEIISKIIAYLNDANNNQWVTAKTLIDKLNIQDIEPLELDDLLVKYFQETADSEIRFSTLPSKRNLDVLWGSVSRIKQRSVSDIYRQDEQLLIAELERVQIKNMFLSHSFKDSKAVIELSKKLLGYQIYPWLAEVEILKHGHINQSVKEAIEKLPYFCVFISENLVESVWSAKEIEFALRNDKEIIGILYTENPDFINSIRESTIKGGTKVSQEIFRRFFDNHLKVKFLLHPDATHGLSHHLENEGLLIDWDYFKNYTQR